MDDLTNPFALNKSTLPVLEEILEQENENLHNLQLLKSKKLIDFGRILSQSEIENIVFPEVCSEVNRFLDAPGITPPQLLCYRYFPQTESRRLAGMYSLSALFLLNAVNFATLPVPLYLSTPLLGVTLWLLLKTVQFHKAKIHDSNLYLPQHTAIQLRRTCKSDVFDTLCHEYTHHVQKAVNPALMTSQNRTLITTILIEGHARGVARNMCNKYALEHHETAFLYDCQNYLTGELKSVYQWCCQNIGISPKKGLLSVKTSIDAVENNIRNSLGMPSPHALGNYSFYSMEKSFGLGIYKAFLQHLLTMQ